MKLILIDTTFLVDMINEKISLKDFEYSEVKVLFPFFYVVLNNLPMIKRETQIDLMGKQLKESYKLFTPEMEETQKTLHFIKLKPEMNWRLKWVLPLKIKYKDLEIFTTNIESDSMYKNENIKTIPFFK